MHAIHGQDLRLLRAQAQALPPAPGARDLERRLTSTEFDQVQDALATLVRVDPKDAGHGLLLGPSGTASAGITVPPTSPSIAGLTLHHAFGVFDSGVLVFVSNAQALTLVP